MILSRFVKLQLTVFALVTVVSVGVMAIVYMRLPALAGIGRYTVSVALPTSGGLYNTANVTYRGMTIGTVTSVRPTTTGAVAELSLADSVRIPKSARADVHSRSAIGEQYVDFVPGATGGPYLGHGDVVPVAQTTVPQDIAPTIDAVNDTLTAIPREQLSAVITETHDSFAGSGSELQRLVRSTQLFLDQLNANTDATTTLIRDLAPLLRSQQLSSPAIRQWAAGLVDSTRQAQANDQHIRNILATGPGSAVEATALFQELQQTAPVIAANLTSLGQVALTYNPAVEQLLVLLPASISALKTINVPNSAGATPRAFLDFNLNLNAPPPCTTGFLPAEQRRDGSAVDAPVRTPEPIYCAIAPDAQNVVRGARNLPCLEVPGKRAPTVALCRGDQQYTPKGTNPWNGDPPVPATGDAVAPAAGPATGPAPLGAAGYDPGSGQYVGRDGRVYTQPALAAGSGFGTTTLASLLTGGV